MIFCCGPDFDLIVEIKSQQNHVYPESDNDCCHLLLFIGSLVSACFPANQSFYKKMKVIFRCLLCYFDPQLFFLLLLQFCKAYFCFYLVDTTNHCQHLTNQWGFEVRRCSLDICLGQRCYKEWSIDNLGKMISNALNDLLNGFFTYDTLKLSSSTTVLEVHANQLYFNASSSLYFRNLHFAKQCFVR